MPPKDYRSTEVINFLKECYERETLKRVIWVTKHEEKLKKFAQFKKEAKHYFDTDVTEIAIKGEMAICKRDFISSGRNRFHVRPNDGEIKGIEALRHGHSIVDIGLGDPKEDPRLNPKDDVTPAPIMRPVNPDEKELLHEIGGRTQYLDRRFRIKPEERFYFAECTNWDYGWRLKDSRAKRGPWHPRNAALMRFLKTRVGPTPDPPHYKTTAITSFCH